MSGMSIPLHITPMQPRQDVHVVKCVVVGDTGVGKTRLICSRAIDMTCCLEQLVQSHVPTVWAIDHYRKDPEVMKRSWANVDGVPVSLRLWDTFGYHDKDRRFAYNRADVVLLCFSVVEPRSLRSVLQHWLPEIRSFCPGVPIILCGCKIDLRYVYRMKKFQELHKGSFYKEITEDDILTPDKGRTAAEEIESHYYETSVMVPYGVDHLFENVIRAALRYKCKKNFWNSPRYFKRVMKPLCQPPYLHPKPEPVKVEIPKSEREQHMKLLLENQEFCDVILITQGIPIQAHKAVLITAAEVFRDVLLPAGVRSEINTFYDKEVTGNEDNHVDESKTVAQHGNVGVGSVNGSTVKSSSLVINRDRSRSDTQKLLENDQMDESSSSLETSVPDITEPLVHIINTTANNQLQQLPEKSYSHQAFHNVETRLCPDFLNPGSEVLKTVLTLNDNITPTALQVALLYCYLGKYYHNPDHQDEVIRAADLLGLTDLSDIATNVKNDEEYFNKQVQDKFHARQKEWIRHLLVEKAVLSDVTFEVDDGEVQGHRVLLMASCEMMMGMFSYNFRESTEKEVAFPGVSVQTFKALLEYLYTDCLPSLCDCEVTEVIELANRLCLSRLMALCEEHVIQTITMMDTKNIDCTEEVLHLVEFSQLHNANTLASWCLWYLSSNYNTIYRGHAKKLAKLRPENQIHLVKHRWPPLWYLKEVENYEKCMTDLARQKPLRSCMRRNSDDLDSGCLGFCGKGRRRVKSDAGHSRAIEA